MAKYGIFGGLAGPWKKENIDNFKPFYVPFTISGDDPPTATTEVTFSEIMAAHNKGREVIATAFIGGVKLLIPMRTVHSTVVGFSHIFDLGSASEETHEPAMLNIMVSFDNQVSVNNIPLAVQE